VPEPSTGATYAAAGVDIAAGDAAVERIKELVAGTHRPGVLGGIGGFAGLFELDVSRFVRPVLVSSTDGVGTKLAVARMLGRYDTIGIDLVAMCVDDLVCVGAEPLYLLDYIATGRLSPERIEQIVAGIAQGCRLAGCSLIGGETAEHPGVMAPEDVDLAGFAVGVVEHDALLGPQRVQVGDVLIGLASPGLRSNGFTLARHVLLERAGLALDGPAWPGAARSLGEEMLLPSVIYAASVRAVLDGEPGAVHAIAHITGGGIPGNLVRVLPEHGDARLQRSLWNTPRIFEEIARLGEVQDAEMARVFNLGLGMVLVCAPEGVAGVLARLAERGQEANVVGQVTPGTGEVHFDS
jgi:phosphoribosylformylglycinamidine cyclo-ligase